MSMMTPPEAGHGRRQLLARCFWAAVSLVSAALDTSRLGYPRVVKHRFVALVRHLVPA